jgi:hypothetical protein
MDSRVVMIRFVLSEFNFSIVYLINTIFKIIRSLLFVFDIKQVDFMRVYLYIINL